MEGKDRQEPYESKSKAGGKNGETLWKWLMKNNGYLKESVATELLRWIGQSIN